MLKTVLIAACNEKDARSTQEILLQMHIRNPIAIMPSADDLLFYLKREESRIRNAQTLAAALILLDLSNRHESGFALLRWLHSHFGAHDIPTAVLTAAENLDQVRRAYQLGVRTFLRKPLNPAEFKAMTDALKLPVFWILHNGGAFDKANSQPEVEVPRHGK